MTEGRLMPTRRQFGVPDLIDVATPAAGANWTFTNDRGELILVRAVNFVLVTSAVAANRVVGLRVVADTRVRLRTAAGPSHVASLTIGYCAFCAAGSTVASVAGVSIPWRDDGVLLRPGDVLASVTAAIDAGDQYSAIALDVMRYSPEYPGPYGPVPGDYTIQQET